MCILSRASSYAHPLTCIPSRAILSRAILSRARAAQVWAVDGENGRGAMTPSGVMLAHSHVVYACAVDGQGLVAAGANQTHSLITC